MCCWCIQAPPLHRPAAPPPRRPATPLPRRSAKCLGDIRKDAAARFSVPLTAVSLHKLNGTQLHDDVQIIEAPTKLYCDVQAADGSGSTRYETELVL